MTRDVFDEAIENLILSYETNVVLSLISRVMRAKMNRQSSAKRHAKKQHDRVETKDRHSNLSTFDYCHQSKVLSYEASISKERRRRVRFEQESRHLEKRDDFSDDSHVLHREFDVRSFVARTIRRDFVHQASLSRIQSCVTSIVEIRRLVRCIDSIETRRFLKTNEQSRRDSQASEIFVRDELATTIEKALRHRRLLSFVAKACDQDRFA